MIAALFLLFLAAYLGCGLVFAIPFALVGAKRIDPRAEHATRGFRLLVLPGAMALWPLLLHRWISGVHEPPEERTAHREAAGPASEITTHRSR
jgi:hypothetical protein